jgi:hypothetical protein
MPIVAVALLVIAMQEMENAYEEDIALHSISIVSTAFTIE